MSFRLTLSLLSLRPNCRTVMHLLAQLYKPQLFALQNDLHTSNVSHQAPLILPSEEKFVV